MLENYLDAADKNGSLTAVEAYSLIFQKVMFNSIKHTHTKKIKEALGILTQESHQSDITNDHELDSRFDSVHC